MPVSLRTAALKQQKLAHLEAQHAELLILKSEYDGHNDPNEEARIIRKCESGVRSIAINTDSLCCGLKQLTETDHDQKQSLRDVQVEIQVYRNPRFPDKLMTTVTILVGGTIEAVFTTFTIVADGAAGFIEAGATGLTTTFVSAGVGLSVGLASRYLGVGLNKAIKKTADAVKRTLAKLVCAFGVSAGVFMSFSAARVRAIGSHHGIMDFDKASLFSTYNDHLSLSTSIIGILVFGLAVYKGRKGYADSVVELAEIGQDLSQDTLADANEITENALEKIDTILDGIEKASLVSTPHADEESNIKSRIIKYKSNIQAAIDECEVLHQQEHERACFRTQRKLALEPLDFTEFDRLHTGLDINPRQRPNDDALEAVRTAHTDATAKIMQAHSEFIASISSYRILPPNQ